MAKDGAEILYLAPCDAYRTPLAAYAVSYAAAFRSSDSITLMPFFGADVPEFVEREPAGIEIVRRVTESVLRTRGASDNQILHAEVGPTTLREFWGAHFAARLRPDIPLCLTLHDPPRLTSLKQFPFLHPRSSFFDRMLTVFSSHLSFFGQKRLAGSLLARASLVVVLSRYGAQLMVKKHWVCRGKTAHLVPLIIGPAPSDPEKRKWLTTGSVRVLVLCCPHVETRFDDLVHALALLRRSGTLSQASVFVRGQVAPYVHESGVLRYMSKRIADLGLGNQVDFQPGPLADGQMDDILAGCEVLVLPYGQGSCNGASLALMRAQAWALAVVASDVGSFREMLANGREGLLYEPGNAEDLAAKLEDMITKRDLRMSMARALRERALRERAPERVFSQMREIYQEILLARREDRAMRIPSGARVEEGGPNE